MAQEFQITPVPEFQPDAELGASLALRSPISRVCIQISDFETLKQMKPLATIFAIFIPSILYSDVIQI